jgi:hypothetical protein
MAKQSFAAPLAAKVEDVKQDAPAEVVAESTAPAKPLYRVTVGDVSKDVEARDEAEAWAVFNTARKSNRTMKQDQPKIELVK